MHFQKYSIKYEDKLFYKDSLMDLIPFKKKKKKRTSL